MPNINEFAEIIAGGNYDHVLPRPADKTSLTLRQVAALYSEMIRSEYRDIMTLVFSVLFSKTLFIIMIIGIVGSYNGWEGKTFVALTLFALIFIFMVWGSVIFSIVNRRKPLSSQKALVTQEGILSQLQSDIDDLARNLGLGSYESLPGYDRKMVAAMALDAGANLYSNSKRIMNSDDEAERRASVRFRQELDELHTLLNRLDLQPAGGYPAYGRRAAELATSSEAA